MIPHLKRGSEAYKNPTKLDHRAHDFDLAEEVDRSHVDGDDHEPEDTDPGSDGHGVSPEGQHGANGLELIGDGATSGYQSRSCSDMRTIVALLLLTSSS